MNDERSEHASLEKQVEETAQCGPGCNCGAPSGSRKMKAVVSLIVVLAVGGIFVYRASSARQNASNNIAAKGGSAFALSQAALLEDKPIVEKTTAPESAKASQKIGEYLGSLSLLNKVALNQDAVFIYIPAKSDEPAASKTNDAVLAARRSLKSNNITLGLYTLPASSPDYSAISAQVQAPAILVACKGKGMAVISGDVTETKLLQAFMAASQAGGCCPSGTGSSDCK